MTRIMVTQAGDFAKAALASVCGSVALQTAFAIHWNRTTREMGDVALQSSGDLAISALKAAMDQVKTRQDQRANLIGMFCNAWNEQTQPEAHRLAEGSGTGFRATRSLCG
jgi:hypothetical protein